MAVLLYIWLSALALNTIPLSELFEGDRDMDRKLVVALSALTERQRGMIRAAAAAHGFETEFYRSSDEAVPHVEDAEIIFTNRETPAAHAPRLKWYCTSNAGFDHFIGDGVFASKEAVLTNSTGAYGVTIAEHIIMVTLEVLRRQQDYNEIIARREWIRDLPIRSIHGSRILLLGTGDIGQHAAARLRSFHPESITGFNRSGINPDRLFDRIISAESLNEALPETDILICALPGTAETTHLIDRARLALLRDGTSVINVGRGRVIDVRALEAELRRHRLCAALDVFEEEPVAPADSLWTCPHLLMTPHVAGNLTLPYTVERIVAMFLEDFERYCAGQPLKHRVDFRRGY